MVPTRRITVVLGLLIAVCLAVLSDLVFSSSRDFWQAHPMLAGLVSSALVLAVTVLVVDERLDRRKARRSRRVAQTAYRELSTAAFAAMVAIARAAEADPYDVDALKQPWSRSSKATRRPCSSCSWSKSRAKPSARR